MDMEAVLQEKTKRIEAIIRKYLPREEGYQKTVLEALNYSMLAGGKRLRPLLMQEAYALFGGGDDEMLEPFLAAMEMIHTYSLVHDDLPAMDNDDYRRGKKTTHAAYGEAMGILAGDALLNYAYETAVKSFDLLEKREYGEGRKLEQYKRLARALKVLAAKPGIYGMLGGQAVDVENNGAPMDVKKLSFVYQWKTGALIEASMMIGAILAGAGETEVEGMRDAAARIGLAFQIQDDILDVTSQTEVLGKPVNSDARNHKTTYVTLLGIENARKEAAKISEEACSVLDSMPFQNDFLRELVIALMHREK